METFTDGCDVMRCDHLLDVLNEHLLEFPTGGSPFTTFLLFFWTSFYYL